jgi:hypothetical protein
MEESDWLRRSPDGGAAQINRVRPAGFFHFPACPIKHIGLMVMLKIENATKKVALYLFGGGGGIRTPEGFYTLPVFKTGAINRSTTPPVLWLSGKDRFLNQNFLPLF